ncbi:uncharacterized protein K02A2.6-like, partial [Eupeodes corollae]|uniref:uncharacterized protein K02A2.6-like n=1 Tax=Eupeodes corollae TaxID=290404 RepID=UPI002492D427
MRMKEGQKYAEWLADLRGAARDCNFVCEKTTCKEPFVDNLLRDIIVLHTPHDVVRSAALQKPNPTLADVYAIAETYESTQKSVLAIKGDSSCQVHQFQLDTGATCSMIGLKAYRQLGEPELKHTNQILKAYGNQLVPIKGATCVSVSWKNNVHKLPLIVTDMEEGSSIMGMDWFQTLKFSISCCNMIEEPSTLLAAAPNANLDKMVRDVCSRFPEVFSPELGCCKDFKAKLFLKPGARPKFCKPRPLPFALMEPVKAELDRLVKAGVLMPVDFSEWAAPIVVVQKQSGSLRICGDFKIGVNPQLDVARHPMPRFEEICHKLKGGQHFTIIDLSEAYFQVAVHDDSKPILVINTPFGLLRFERLPPGVASAPGIFQSLIEQVIGGMDHCAAFVDDLIVTGRNPTEHCQNLEELLHRFSANGLRCNITKCKFAQSSVRYLGHQIDSEGDFSSKSAPLNELRKKSVPFIWTERQQNAFQSLKRSIVDATKLVHFRDDYPLILACDASSYGIGAVLLHRYPDRTERPIAHASKTLNDAQKKYSQVEKEALSIIFGVQKFHQYVYGRRFELITDHKPLLSLFHPQKQLPVMTAHRLQRWAIILMVYEYSIRYKPTLAHGNADALSRLPAGSDQMFDNSEACLEATLELDEDISNFPLNAKLIAKMTLKDPVLKKILEFVETGWPETSKSLEPSLKPYFARRFALTFHNGVLVYQTNHIRVVIPSCLQDRVFKLLHAGHWGVVRTKQLSRLHCWWPALDEYIERSISQYALSNFPYVVEMGSTTSEATIKALQNIFAIEEFCHELGIVHIKTAPFHPASNGEAERMVRTFKTAIQKQISEGVNERDALLTFLTSYRSTPNVTGKSPSELLHGRPMCSLLSQLKPMSKPDIKTVSAKFHPEQQVFIRNYARGPKWITGVVQTKIGRKMYQVKTSKGTVRRHQNQMRGVLSSKEFDAGQRLIDNTRTTSPQLEVDNRPSTSVPPQ